MNDSTHSLFDEPYASLDSVCLLASCGCRQLNMKRVKLCFSGVHTAFVITHNVSDSYASGFDSCYEFKERCMNLFIFSVGHIVYERVAEGYKKGHQEGHTINKHNIDFEMLISFDHNWCCGYYGWRSPFSCATFEGCYGRTENMICNGHVSWGDVDSVNIHGSEVVGRRVSESRLYASRCYCTLQCALRVDSRTLLHSSRDVCVSLSVRGCCIHCDWV